MWRVSFRKAPSLTDPETNVPNHFAAEALLQLPEDARFRDALEFVMQRRLENAHEQSAFS